MIINDTRSVFSVIKKVLTEGNIILYLLTFICVFMYNYFEFVREETVIVYKGDHLYCTIALNDHHAL